MNAQYLAQLSRAIGKIHALSNFPLTPFDRTDMDVSEGISQAESIEEQLKELEAVKSQIENIIIEINKI